MELSDPFYPFGLPPGVRLALLDHASAAEHDLVLPDTEMLRIGRLKVAGQQEDIRRSFVLRRKAIAEMTGADIQNLDLQWSAEGAPQLVSPPGWSISVSGVAGVTALAIAHAGTRVGVDLSQIRDIGWSSMLGMVSAPEEQHHFRGKYVPNSDISRFAFHRLWVIKEAVLKATGRGMKAGAKNVPVTMDWLDAPAAAFSLTAFEQRFTGVLGETGSFAVCVVMSAVSLPG